MEKLEHLHKKGGRIEALRNKPPIDYPDLLDAYYDIRFAWESSRAIPLHEVTAWLDLHCIRHPDERRLFFEVVRGLDAEFLKWMKERKDADAATRNRLTKGKARSRRVQ